MKKSKKSKLYKFYLKCYNISKQDGDFSINTVIRLFRSVAETKSNKRIKKHNIIETNVTKFGLRQCINKRTGKAMFYKRKTV